MIYTCFLAYVGVNPGFFQRRGVIASIKQQHTITFVTKNDRNEESDKFRNFPVGGGATPSTPPGSVPAKINQYSKEGLLT